MIRKIKTSLTAKLFLATTVLLILVCLLSVFSMARYIPQTYSNRLSAELQKQANDLVPVLEQADSLEECYSLVQQFVAQTKATAYIEDGHGDILYSSDELTITTDKDSVATIQEHSDSGIVTDDELLTEAGYVFSLLGQDYTLYVQSDTVSVNQATEAIWQTVPLVILGIFFMSILFSVIYSRYITKPIIELSSTSQKMAQLDFEPHGNSNRSDEIGILADSLNTLSDNLQHTLAELKKSNSELEAEISKERELEKKQQEFFSAASHELKTPLTILKGHLMGMLNKVKGYENQEAYMDSTMETWSYESLCFYVDKDGIESMTYSNPYTIGKIKTENLNLLSFSEVMKIYEKMMVVTNADNMQYENSRVYNIDRIVLGYARIYEPSTDAHTGILIPVWDFFGSMTSESEYNGETESNTSKDPNESFLTINAVDGSIIDRNLGY